MTDELRIDTSELRTLTADLGRASGAVTAGADAVLKRGAQNVKVGMVDAFKRSTHFRQVAPAVSYDRLPGIGSITYEIGPTIGGAGSLAGIAVDGGARGGGGTVDVDSVLTGEAPNVERELGKLLGGLL
jgi:hypothetical protein